MLTKIIQFSVRNKLIIALFTVGLIVYGAFQLTKLPIDAVPDITDNQVQVITVAPSLGAPDVERLVTFPVEQANSNIPGIKEIRSFSRFGLSLVTIVFDEQTDVYWARQQVAERLQQAIAKIPKGVGIPEMGPVTTGLGEIYQYVLKPEKGYENKFSPMDLRTIQDWIVRRQLIGVKGVADVSSFGGLLKQYEIAVDANRLKATGVTMNEVFDALAKNNQNTGGAYIEKGPNLLFIRSEGLLKNREDIENIPIKTNTSGMPVLLRDVGEINFGNATRYGTLFYNNEMEVAGAVVMMLKGANSNEVIKNVKERVEQIKKNLPKGVIIEPFLDRTKMVNNAIGTVKTNLMEGALIVVLVLVLFLGNFRAGFLVASVIPLAMLFAIILMNLFGVSGNLMSLGALDFGLIIDGAVIIVEAVLHFLTHSKKLNHTTPLNTPEMDGIVEKTAGRMMNSAVFGQIIILVVYLPVFALSGIEGKMFKPMAQTVTFALLGAFVLSLTYVPMMSAWFLSKKVSHKPTFSDRMMGKIEKIYQHFLGIFLQKTKLVLGISISLLIISALVVTQIGGEFIPELEEGDFAIETRILTGSNLKLSMETTKKAATVLKDNFPEVIKVVGKIGSGEIPTDPMPIEAQDLMVILKDKSEWTSAETFDELAEKMGKKLADIPGVSFGFQFPVQMRFNELMTGARQDVVCKIFGEDLDSLAHFAQRLGAISAKVDGAADVYVEPVGGLPQIVIQYNRQAIAAYGVNIEDINRIVNTAFAGQSAGQVFEGEKRFDLVVRLNMDSRNSKEDVQDLLIPVPNGDQIPLNQLAKVEIIEGPNQIQREDAKRRIIVGFNVRGRDVQSIVEELQKKAEKQLHLPPGYYITYGGAFENLQAAKKRLGIAVPISLLLIFLLLYFAFGSIKDGLLIYSAIPLSAIGGILSLAARGMPFSISAGVGFIALFGVAVLNGIVLISEFNRLKAEGWTDLRQIVIHGTKIRLRPVLMTAAVASLGFLPMALSHGAGAEVQRPLATVVIGGLVTATFLTLFVLPIIYIMFHQKNKPAVTGNKNIVAVIIALLSFGFASAQNSINMQSAIDSALKNNIGLQGEYKNVQYFEAMKKTAVEPDPTQIEGQYGQFNSIFTDNRFGIRQTLDFPIIYRYKRNYLSSEFKLAEINYQFKTLELKREVQKQFYNLVYLQQKQAVLQRADSMYGAMLEVANSKLQSGETNLLERDFILVQRFQANNQLKQLQTEKENAILIFQKLLNTRNPWVPNPDYEESTPIPVFTDTTFISKRPELRLALETLQLNIARKQIQKSALYPRLDLGYNSTTIQGFGADNNQYTLSKRFNSVQIGIGIPIMASAAKNRIKAQDYLIQKSDLEAEKARQDIWLKWETLWKEYQTQLNAINWYRNTGLITASTMLETARNQYRNGEIDYLQFATLFNQILTIYSDHSESEFKYNTTLIELNAISNP